MFLSFAANHRLCPVTALRAYEKKTRDRREGKDHPQLLISLIKPYNPLVSTPTIARWLKAILAKVGIDTYIFKAHSISGACTSAAASAGMTTNDILKAANWSSESVFQKFYYKPEQKGRFGTAVLHVFKLPTTETESAKKSH